MEPFPRPVRQRVAADSADASEGRGADPAHDRCALGGRSRLQPRLPHPPGPRPHARHAAQRPGHGRVDGAVTVGHLPATVERHPGRGHDRGPGRGADAHEPRGVRRHGQRRDVRADLRLRGRRPGQTDRSPAGADGPDRQRSDARRDRPAARHAHPRAGPDGRRRRADDRQGRHATGHRSHHRDRLRALGFAAHDAAGRTVSVAEAP